MRTYIKMPFCGVCDDSGSKNAAEFGFNPKIVADKDLPVSGIVIAVLDRCHSANVLGWSSAVAAKADIDLAIRKLQSLKKDVRNGR